MPFSPGSLNTKEITPLDYTIKSLLIISDQGEVDVTYLLSELNINENMFNKCITGSLILTDTLNLISNLPIMEGDLIKGFFTRNEIDPYVADFDPDFELDFIFEIIKISSQTKTKQDVQVISLGFVSSTWTDHLSGRVSKSYRQMPYSDMVSDIYGTWLSRGGLKGALPPKPLNFTGTDQLWNIIIPNKKPLDAITFLSRRSFKGDAVNYLFWEDKFSFNFRPFEEILAAGPVAEYWVDAPAQYTADDPRVPDAGILAPRYLNLINVRFLEYHDISMAAMTGMLGNRLIKHDLFNKTVIDYFPRGEVAPNYILDLPYDYYGDFAKLSHVDGTKEMVLPFTNLKMAEDDGNTLISVCPEHAFQYDDQPAFSPELWVRQRKGQIAQLKFIKFEVSSPGNFTRKVGDKIFVKLDSPEYKPRKGGQAPKPDSKLSGNYIITALRRKFTKDTYVNVMEIIKDNYYDLKNDLYESEAAPDKIDITNQSQVGRL